MCGRQLKRVFKGVELHDKLFEALAVDCNGSNVFETFNRHYLAKNRRINSFQTLKSCEVLYSALTSGYNDGASF